MTGTEVRSAKRVLSRSQAAVLALACAALACLLATAPALTIPAVLVCAAGVCSVISIYQLIVFAIGIRTPATPPIATPDMHMLDGELGDVELPRYTVLLPVYRETAVLADLVLALDRLDYPKRLLDVKWLVEADDQDTLDALRAMPLGPQFELLLVPAGGPRTKPKACNFGLRQARGEFVVTFDAEDVPEPDQLRKAVTAFRSLPADVGCLQARLGIWNPGTNLLTRYITARLCANFNVRRVALERLGAPVLLGGTSNHFRVEVLRELGGWDPFNVTEDADVGVRLARAGYRTRLLDSWTYEEASTQLGNWIRQQSRWIKGFTQTCLVHGRNPAVLVRELGAGPAAHIQATLVGGIVPVLLAPLLWGATLLWILVAVGALVPPVPAWVLAASAGSLAFGATTSTWAYVVALRRFGYAELASSCILFPALELVRSIAAFKALAQLMIRPSYWEKTVHGLEPRAARDAQAPASAR